MWLNNDPKYAVLCPLGFDPSPVFIGSYSLVFFCNMNLQGYLQVGDFYHCACGGRPGFLCRGGDEPVSGLCRFERDLDAIDYSKMIQERDLDGRLMFLKQLRMLDKWGSIEEGFAVVNGMFKAGKPHLLTSPLLQPHEKAVFDFAFRMALSAFSPGPILGKDTGTLTEKLREGLPRVANQQGMFTRWNNGSFDLEATDGRFAVSNAVAQG